MWRKLFFHICPHTSERHHGAFHVRTDCCFVHVCASRYSVTRHNIRVISLTLRTTMEPFLTTHARPMPISFKYTAAYCARVLAVHWLSQHRPQLATRGSGDRSYFGDVEMYSWAPRRGISVLSNDRAPVGERENIPIFSTFYMCRTSFVFLIVALYIKIRTAVFLSECDWLELVKTKRDRQKYSSKSLKFALWNCIHCLVDLTVVYLYVNIRSR